MTTLRGHAPRRTLSSAQREKKVRRTKWGLPLKASGIYLVLSNEYGDHDGYGERYSERVRTRRFRNITFRVRFARE